jgi:hypothetical protein
MNIDWLLEKYNKSLALMDGTTGPVKQMFAADVVYGVWPDASKPAGIDYIVVKGIALMTNCVADNQSFTATVAVVPCSCLEHAVAAQRVFGDERGLY